MFTMFSRYLVLLVTFNITLVSQEPCTCIEWRPSPPPQQLNICFLPTHFEVVLAQTRSIILDAVLLDFVTCNMSMVYMILCLDRFVVCLMKTNFDWVRSKRHFYKCRCISLSVFRRLSFVMDWRDFAVYCTRLVLKLDRWQFRMMGIHFNEAWVVSTNFFYDSYIKSIFLCGDITLNVH